MLGIVGIDELDELFAGIVKDTVFRTYPQASETVLADRCQVGLRQSLPAGVTGIEVMRLRCVRDKAAREQQQYG